MPPPSLLPVLFLLCLFFSPSSLLAATAEINELSNEIPNAAMCRNCQPPASINEIEISNNSRLVPCYNPPLPIGTPYHYSLLFVVDGRLLKLCFDSLDRAGTADAIDSLAGELRLEGERRREFGRVMFDHGMAEAIGRINRPVDLRCVEDVSVHTSSTTSVPSSLLPHVQRLLIPSVSESLITAERGERPLPAATVTCNRLVGAGILWAPALPACVAEGLALISAERGALLSFDAGYLKEANAMMCHALAGGREGEVSYVEGGTNFYPFKLRPLQNLLRGVLDGKGEEGGKGAVTVCEIGYNLGHSSLLWLMEDERVRVKAFDLGEHGYSHRSAEYMRRWFGEDRIEVVFGLSEETVPAAEPLGCDLVFIDGGHQFSVARADILNCRRHANPYAVLVVDDINQEMVGRAWDSVEAMGLVEEIGVVFEQEHYLSARLYWCGWSEFNPFVTTLFPDYALSPYPSRPPRVPTPSDLLVISRNNCAANSFPGATLYIDGENGAIQLADQGTSSVYYLGITKPPPEWSPPLPVKGSLPLHYMVLEMTITPALLNAHDLATLHTRRPPPPTHFLTYVQSNCLSSSHVNGIDREGFYDKLVAKVRQEKGQDPVAQGKCHGSHPETSWRKNDRAMRLNTTVGLYADYKFGLVFENSLVDGYVTEKIATAFSGGAVPVYCGARDVLDLFNEDAFVYVECGDAGKVEKAIERIVELANDPVMYDKMRRVPIIKAPVEDTLRKYFSVEDGVGGGELKRKIRGMLGIDDGFPAGQT